MDNKVTYIHIKDKTTSTGIVADGIPYNNCLVQKYNCEKAALPAQVLHFIQNGVLEETTEEKYKEWLALQDEAVANAQKAIEIKEGFNKELKEFNDRRAGFQTEEKPTKTKTPPKGKDKVDETKVATDEKKATDTNPNETKATDTKEAENSAK